MVRVSGDDMWIAVCRSGGAEGEGREGVEYVRGRWRARRWDGATGVGWEMSGWAGAAGDGSRARARDIHPARLVCVRTCR